MRLKPFFFLFPLFLLAGYICLAPYPTDRAARVFFGSALPIYQFFKNVLPQPGASPDLASVHEKPEALAPLRTLFHLDKITQGATTDFEKWVTLTNWVRDQFPHASPKHTPPSQSFDGVKMLTEDLPQEKGFLCGTAAQLLVQAIEAMGGKARRVELRFTHTHKHAVVEAWSDAFKKWIVFDPDSNIYYTQFDIPLNAWELHQIWSQGHWETLVTHVGPSPNSIYKKQNEAHTQPYLTMIYQEMLQGKNEKKWDKEISAMGYDNYMKIFTQAKLLNLYSQISYPLRTDWKSRPLPWWNPAANHVQNSVQLALPTSIMHEDFIHQMKDPTEFYKAP